MAKTSSSKSSFLVNIYRIIGFVMILPIVLFVWNYFFVERPQTVGSTIVNSLDNKDNEIENAQTFLNVNYLKNIDGTGHELLEAAFTSYATQNSTNLITQGLQCYDGVKSYEEYDWAAEHSTIKQISKDRLVYTSPLQYTSFYRTVQNLYYSKNVTNISYFDITQIDEQHSTAMISMSPVRTVDNSNFILTTKQTTVDDQNNVTEVYTPISLQFKKTNSNLLFSSDYVWNVISMKTQNYYSYAGIENFMYSLENSVKSLDAGTHYLYIDLSDWFDVFLYDSVKQDFTRQTADIQYTYILMKVTVSNQGATRDSQSMFGKIAKEDGSFDFNSSDSSPFWKYKNNYTITNDDFELVDYGTGKMMVLNSELIDYLSSFKDLYIHIEINLDELPTVVAINGLSLKDIQYKTITITGTESRNLIVKYGSQLNVESIAASSGINVTIENSNIIVGVV